MSVVISVARVSVETDRAVTVVGRNSVELASTVVAVATVERGGLVFDKLHDVDNLSWCQVLVVS